jgi:hypothetical protein
MLCDSNQPKKKSVGVGPAVNREGKGDGKGEDGNESV